MKRFLLSDWLWVCGPSAVLIATHLAWGEMGANTALIAIVTGGAALCVWLHRRLQSQETQDIRDAYHRGAAAESVRQEPQQTRH